MKRILRIVAIVLMLACMLVLIPTGALEAQAEIIEYDQMKQKEKIIKPQESGYVGPWEYVDPSISVKIETGRIYDTNYRVAHIKLANASQLRTQISGSYSRPSASFPVTMARSVNAVFAINGDYFSTRNNIGYIVRWGKEFRNKDNGKYDVLAIDNCGDLHILKVPEKADVDAFKAQLAEQGRSVISAFTFGPGLVINGEKQTGFVDQDNAADRGAQRMCLAQIGPLEYLCIASEGPEDPPDENGLTLEQFAELVASFEGVTNAYNLDGGSSTHMVFRMLDEKTGRRKYEKINSPNNPKRRPLIDIIYFASAYQPE